MKIFNWVHRRFSHKDGKLAENANKSSLINIDDDNAFCNMFGGWNGGILTIGTLGYDPLLSDDVSFYEQDQPGNDIDQTVDYDKEEEAEEEVNPLVYNAHDSSHEFDDAKTEKVRTTLAELFSADHDEQGLTKMVKLKSTHTHRLSFAKKLIIGEDAHPIHKLQQVMKRMLKKKVHPELGDPKPKSKPNPNPKPKPIIVINSKVMATKCCSTTAASASLFPTQDANV